MNGREIMQYISSGKIPPRIPFAPTIYEHAAKIINVTPSQMARDPDLIVAGQLTAYRLYRHDIVSVGVDIYNVEAEALGCRVIFPLDEVLPYIDGVLLSEDTDLNELKIPDPHKDGRMPVFLEACRKIHEKIGDEVPVNGTIVGPFTLAAILRGFEDFLMDLMFEPDSARRLLKFTKQIGLTYAKAFIDCGVGVAVNESWIAPPLLSPDLFSSIVLPFETGLIKEIKQLGLKNVALISGGDTAPIAQYLVETGTSLLMADYNTDQRAISRLCRKHGINLRASIDAKIVEYGNEEEMTAAAEKVISTCAEGGRFIFGCGVASYNTPAENINLLKQIVEKLNPYNR
ncbi:MAG: hypothetical protein GX045_11470 [Clostridiaceae bacterium]|jgi:uroporphyrinogen decarboxylase|nr:hypothetical protein [Clostridiaceae bacterium]